MCSAPHEKRFQAILGPFYLHFETTWIYLKNTAKNAKRRFQCMFQAHFAKIGVIEGFWHFAFRV